MRIRCKHCGVIIESKNRHNSVWCKCGKVGIDGGNDYIKISGYIGDWDTVIEKIVDEYIEPVEELSDD